MRAEYRNPKTKCANVRAISPLRRVEVTIFFPIPLSLSLSFFLCFSFRSEDFEVPATPARGYVESIVRELLVE